MYTLILTLVFLVASPAFAAELLLENAQIVDVDAQELRPGHIVVHDDRIVAVLAQPPAPFDGTRLDLAGQWVMPGLYDLHTHAHGNKSPSGALHRLGLKNAARAMLYAGVTGFLDLFSEENAILELRDRQRAGTLRTPDEMLADIHAAGPVFTCSGGHGTEYGMFTRVINTPEQAHLEIAALAYKHPDVIKIIYDHAFTRFPTLDPDTLQAAIATAKRFQLRTVIHIGTWQDAEDAIRAGADAITHTHGAPIPERLVQLMRARETVYIPTLAVQSELLNILEQPALLERPLLTAMVPAGFLETYRKPELFPRGTSFFLTWQQNGREQFFTNFKTLLDAGIPTLAGTDVGNIGTFQGYSLHRELELMVAHGATPWQALASATTLAGRFLQEEAGIRPGARANLVVLDASPVADIQNTTKITTVIYRGHVVDRQALQRTITQGFPP
jgi:imidazolonepropionase-like amidohydrolase